jgi:hypothetical protein
MLRVTWDAGGQEPRLATEDQFLSELEQLALGDFVDAPAGTLLVEGFDAQSRPSWRGYYSGSSQLRTLLIQLHAERVITRERAVRRQDRNRGQ